MERSNVGKRRKREAARALQRTPFAPPERLLSYAMSGGRAARSPGRCATAARWRAPPLRQAAGAILLGTLPPLRAFLGSSPLLRPHPRTVGGSRNGGRRLPSSPRRTPLSGLPVTQSALFWDTSRCRGVLVRFAWTRIADPSFCAREPSSLCCVKRWRKKRIEGSERRNTEECRCGCDRCAVALCLALVEHGRRYAEPAADGCAVTAVTQVCSSSSP